VATVESIESWRGQDVLDSAGETVGRLEEVYHDAAGDEPVLISIKRGRLGHQVKLAPLSDAAASRDYVRLPFTGQQLGGSPDVTVGDELAAEQARRRADELELTAEEARHRAGAASEEARAAQRAREEAEAAAADPSD
jgi:PRC-barrel domain protein